MKKEVDDNALSISLTNARIRTKVVTGFSERIISKINSELTNLKRKHDSDEGLR